MINILLLLIFSLNRIIPLEAIINQDHIKQVEKNDNNIMDLVSNLNNVCNRNEIKIQIKNGDYEKIKDTK